MLCHLFRFDGSSNSAYPVSSTMFDYFGKFIRRSDA